MFYNGASALSGESYAALSSPLTPTCPVPYQVQGLPRPRANNSAGAGPIGSGVHRVCSPSPHPLPPGEREMRAEILGAGAEEHTLCIVENN